MKDFLLELWGAARETYVSIPGLRLQAGALGLLGCLVMMTIVFWRFMLPFEIAVAIVLFWIRHTREKGSL